MEKRNLPSRKKRKKIRLFILFFNHPIKRKLFNQIKKKDPSTKLMFTNSSCNNHYIQTKIHSRFFRIKLFPQTNFPRTISSIAILILINTHHLLNDPLFILMHIHILKISRYYYYLSYIIHIFQKYFDSSSST